MELKRAAFLDLASVYRDDLDLSALEAAVPEWLWFDQIKPEQLSSVLSEVDVVVSNKVMLDKQVLSQAAQRGRLALRNVLPCTTVVRRFTLIWMLRVH